MRRLAIYGAGGHGKVVADAAEVAGWSDIRFYDESYSQRSHNGAWPIVGNFEMLLKERVLYDGVIVAIGHNQVRLEKHALLKADGANMVTIIHPSAVVSDYAQIGDGTVVLAGSIINAFTTVGEAVIVNTLASIDHDCVIEKAVHICPGCHLAGHVSVGEYAWVGIGSSVIQGVHIAPHALLGAGSVVVRDITCRGTYVGVPAKLVVKN